MRLPFITRGSLDVADIPITETWYRNDWSYFDTYQGTTSLSSLGRNGSSTYPYSLNGQRHVDLRAWLPAESWSGTGLTTGYISALNNWPGATIVMPVGTTTYQSVGDPIDLTTVDDGYLTLALPDFPLGSVTLNQTYLDLTSDGFSEAVCSLRWSDSTPTPTSGNTSLRWAYSALQGIDLTQVNGIRFRITATASATLYMLALRLIGPNWVQTNLDFDNYNGQLRQTIPLNGDTSAGAVDVPANQQLPILLRSSIPSGDHDPSPINGSVGILFNTGSQTQSNVLRMYMRELTTAFITQIDLEGASQLSLTGQPQPTSGISEYAPRTMGDLDQLTMGELDLNTMLNLERTQDSQFISWQGAMINWGPGPSVQITNSTGATGYTYTTTAAPNLAAHTTYLAVFSLNDINAQLIIYSVDQTTLAINKAVFDSGVIADASMFTRRGGRVGFQAVIQDGDAWIGSIRPMGLTYAQYQSEPFTSVTPVAGARLYVHNSQDPQYWKTWTAVGGSIVPDTNRSTTGQSTRVTVPGVTVTGAYSTSAGVISNALSADDYTGLTDFDQLSISFDLWMPSALANANTNGIYDILIPMLISDTGYIVPLMMPQLQYDHWQHVNLTMPTGTLASGIYQLQVAYQGSATGQFWIDNVIVKERAVAWAARSVIDDPWNSNFAPWTPFADNLNDDSAGVRFYPQGKQLQMQAEARTVNAVVLSAPKLVPAYAQLGRFAWPEDAVALTGNPVANIAATNITGSTYTFDGSRSTGVLSTQSIPFIDNYVTNPSFEHDTVGAAPAAWTTTGATLTAGATLTVVNTPVLIGSQALKIVTSAVSQGAFLNLGTLPAGDYEFSWAIKQPTTSGNVFAGVKDMGSTVENSVPVSAGWTNFTTGFATDGTAASPIWFRATGAQTLIVDAITVSLDSRLSTYGDGDKVGWGWTGTPGNSTSGITSNTHPIVNWQWSFSDGSYASGPVVTHTFTTGPPQYATLMVTDSIGQTAITQWVHS